MKTTLFLCLCFVFLAHQATAVDPCSFMDCAHGSVCVVDQFTGRTYCEPSCEIDNGGCGPDKACRLVDSEECSTVPCEKIIECVDPCATVRCANGYSCEVYKGRAYCNPSCSINNGGCATNEKCTLVQVECITDPCPPTIECEPRED